jgi:rod shape-determining protein MreC
MKLQQKETLDALHERGTEINASIAEQFSRFGDLLSLKQDNERLLLQNARLLSRVMLQSTALQDTRNLQNIVIRDSTVIGRFKIARIVDRRFNARENVLVINAGSLQGIEKDMTVLTPDGLVGRVIAVSKNYARILPVINNNFKVSVVSDCTSTFGILSWKGGDEHIAHVEHIPISSRLRLNELMVTSDYSTFAIRGIPVGRIVHIEKDKLFYDIDVRLAVDFSSISYVLISPTKPPQEKIEVISGEIEQKQQQVPAR